jgi:2-dehydropantoate 2-reductase
MVDDLEGVRWSKLAINCATSTLGAAGGNTLGVLLRRRYVRRLALEIWAELAAVAAAQGIKLAKVMGTFDIAKLAITEEERRHRIGSAGLFYKHSLLLGLGLKFRRMRSSMAIAIERGRKPEIDYLNGEIVRRGRELNLPTPVNSALCALIHDIVAGRARAGESALYSVYQRHCTGRPPAPPPLLPALREGRLAVDPSRRDVPIGERP